MKKNITANINGIIFHIDEDAYEKLDIYLQKIKEHYKNNESFDEIVNGIENRIAELLKDKLSETKNVITIQDVSEVINIMGQPVSENDVDNIITENKIKNKKKLYRDPDDKILGGVCSGLGHYFGIQPIWIRLIFIIACFIFGSSLLIYIILWAVIPIASTTIEKLEMKGEPVNIDAIEKNIRKELEDIKNNFNKIKDKKNKITNKKISSFVEKVITSIVIFFKYLIKALSSIIGIIFIMIGVFLTIGFISILFDYNEISSISSGGISGRISLPFLLNNILSSSKQLTIIVIGLCLFVGVPLIMLIYQGIKMIFHFKIKTKIIGISAFSLWLVGLVLCAIIGLQTIDDFSHKYTTTKKFSTKIKNSKNIIHFITLPDNEIDSLFNPDNRLLLGNWNIVSKKNKGIFFGIPTVEIKTSENDSVKIILFASAKANNSINAYKRAEKIIYNINSNDTALFFSPYYRLDENEKWRGQELKLLVKIPANKKIIFDKSMERLLLTASNFDKYCNMDLTGSKWLVTPEGLVSYNRKDTLP